MHNLNKRVVLNEQMLSTLYVISISIFGVETSKVFLQLSRRSVFQIFYYYLDISNNWMISTVLFLSS